MPLKSLIIGSVLAIIALIGFLSFLFLSSPSPKPPAPTQSPETPLTNNKSFEAPAVQYAAPPTEQAPERNSSAAINVPTTPDSNAPFGERQAVIDKIHDAMSTYSSEGVSVIQPFLTSPDSEIREHAIEAMKQLDAPEAAAALRAAAYKANDPRDRQAMLDAADFVELPAYNPTE